MELWYVQSYQEGNYFHSLKRLLTRIKELKNADIKVTSSGIWFSDYETAEKHAKKRAIEANDKFVVFKIDLQGSFVMLPTVKADAEPLI